MTQKTKIRFLFLMIIILVVVSSFAIVPKSFSFKILKWQVNVIASQEVSQKEFSNFYKSQTGQNLPADYPAPYFLPTNLAGKDLESAVGAKEPVLPFYPVWERKNGALNIMVKNRYHLGLDLRGGTELIYELDIKGIASSKRSEAINGVLDVIERRVNLFGIAEPVIYIDEKNRLVVELAGIKDTDQAIKMIGETPYLDFREEAAREQFAAFYKQQTGQDLPADYPAPYFLPSGLTGKDLVRGEVDFDPTTGNPVVNLEFNDRGKQSFADLTARLAPANPDPQCKNKGKILAIFLDNRLVEAPAICNTISSGKAVISGNFTIDTAKTLAKRLNAGALPVAIKLVNQATVDAALGQNSLSKTLKAGIYGFILVILFMILYYRVPGMLASLALIVYTILVLALFNLIPVTLTLAGIAGLILSIGMAVDANVLIFSRMREELAAGKTLALAIHDGFGRAWPSIRDSNLTTLITSTALFWFGSGSIKGFALTLAIGVIISMFSAITITRTFLFLVLSPRWEKYKNLF